MDDEPRPYASAWPEPVEVPKVRIVLADDERLIRAGLSLLLAAEPDLEVVGEAANGAECLEIHYCHAVQRRRLPLEEFGTAGTRRCNPRSCERRRLAGSGHKTVKGRRIPVRASALRTLQNMAQIMERQIDEKAE
ncbi:hypothetical protein FBY31_1756 [Arthrobacter sp. SLBN-100]|uniref:response regulator transcription factor n=1 Tax=Arthrobacter sp. SLBN-100 TaxID=2768450 RepID=UPI001173A78B|nr:hypothetical protein [Arthrobacter sp. SLBN-100]TQJ67682.1 hypothetical protein FBY31_1756 [Arthrobacter sp. SLBN-100]